MIKFIFFQLFLKLQNDQQTHPAKPAVFCLLRRVEQISRVKLGKTLCFWVTRPEDKAFTQIHLNCPIRGPIWKSSPSQSIRVSPTPVNLKVVQHAAKSIFLSRSGLILSFGLTNFIRPNTGKTEIWHIPIDRIWHYSGQQSYMYFLDIKLSLLLI